MRRLRDLLLELICSTSVGVGGRTYVEGEGRV